MPHTQNNLIITNDSVKKRLKDYKPEQSISEYIENSIDAGAKNIYVNYTGNSLDSVDSFEIIDDGCGFSEKDLENTFRIFMYSSKNRSLYHSDVFGKDGIGRLTFLTFATKAEWESSTKSQTIKLSISKADLCKYDILERKEIYNEQTGTKVRFFNVEITKTFLDKKLPEELIIKFSWIHYLKGIKIIINGKDLDFSKYVEKEYKKEIEKENYKFNLQFIKWKKCSPDEESKNYFIKSNGEEVLKIGTSLNRQSDNFFHSVYIKSSFFDNISLNEKGEKFYFSDDEIGKENKLIYNSFMHELDICLINFRKPFINDFAEKYIDSNVQITGKESILEMSKKNILRTTIKEIYLQEPKIFTQLSDDQTQIFINLIGLILEEGNNNKLFDIIGNVLNLTQEERLKFGNLVNEISLSNIIKTIEIIKSRLETIELLHKLIFDKNLGTKENPDLQDVVSRNYWIFGEEYHLLAGTGELKFQKVLSKFLGFVDPSANAKKIKHSSVKKELDLLLAQQERLTGRTKNIVIELKHPNKTIGRNEANQVLDYFDLIYNEDQFNGQNFERKFYLVGNKINKQIETLYENSKHHGDHVIHKDTSNGKNYTIYCYTWSDLLESNKQRLEYLKKSLELNLDNFNDEVDKINDKEEIKTLLKKKK